VHNVRLDISVLRSPSELVGNISHKDLLSPQALTEMVPIGCAYEESPTTQHPTTTMDPLQQPVADSPAVAEPDQPPVEEQAPEVSEPQVPFEQPLEHPPEQPAPVSVNVGESVPERAGSRVGIDNGYSSDSKAYYHSRSTDFHHAAPEYAPHDTDQSARLASSPPAGQQPQLQPSSRPSSSFSSGPEKYGLSQQQPSEVAQRQVAQSQSAKNSVVIKVGMVGDAQIGKTSLMVKYVEGSWDEDYIQTLGMCERILISSYAF